MLKRSVRQSDKRGGGAGMKLGELTLKDITALEHFRAGVELKHQEMIDLMRRNKIGIDNLEDPMQKLAFTFFSEIAELSYKAEVIRKERGQHGK